MLTIKYRLKNLSIPKKQEKVICKIKVLTTMCRIYTISTLQVVLIAYVFDGTDKVEKSL